MEVRFRRSYLERCSESVSLATRRWGHPAGRSYTEAIRLIEDIDRFQSLFAFRHLNFHPLRGNRKGEYAMRIGERLRVIVEYDRANQIVLIKEVTHHYED